MKLNGKHLDLNSISRGKEMLIKFLDSSLADELFTSNELQKQGFRQAREYAADFPAYTLKAGGVRYWGNPKAIKELDKQLKAAR